MVFKYFRRSQLLKVRVSDWVCTSRVDSRDNVEILWTKMMVNYDRFFHSRHFLKYKMNVLPVEGVFISKINSSGAVRRDGRLKVGMRILEVNGQSLLGATHQEAVESLRLSANKLNLVVCKGYEKSDLIHGMISSGTGSRLSSEAGSELSLNDLESSTVIQNSHAEELLGKLTENEVFEEPKGQELINTSQEIARLANEVAMLSQVENENALVSAREKTTPEKV
jgi:protein scribble